MVKLSFHGGAREVTGSCYLLEAKNSKILIDCGISQGSSEFEELNYTDFKFDPAQVDAVFITHAHLDHVGRLPKLVHDGFKGRIYSTAPTRDLASLILEDAYGLQEKRDKNLFSKEDLQKTLDIWREAPYYEEIETKDFTVILNNAGHILGSSLIEVFVQNKHLLFTGDLGNIPSVLLPPPDVHKDIMYLTIESTYGDRLHEPADQRALLLERAVEDTVARGGTLMIPAFATERTQDILFLLNQMLQFKRVPNIPMFVDAPLAIKVTKIYEKYVSFYKEDIQNLYKEHQNLFKFKTLKFTESVNESKSINDVAPPKVIIAGSGMMSGGRILHHAKRYLGDKKSILLFAGYQAAGSLGRRLTEGMQTAKIFGNEIPVRAEVRQVRGFSAHADSEELFKFVEYTRDALSRVFVVQGEEESALYFMQEIKDRLGIEADAPRLFDSIELK